MAKARGTFHIHDPKSGRDIVVEEGQTIPEHLLGSVGTHLGGTRSDTAATNTSGEGETPFDGEAFDAAVQARVDEVLADAQAAFAEDRDAREDAAYGAEGYGNFDPNEVNADVVLLYLEGLDLGTTAGRREYDRVAKAEEAGKNRATAFPKTPPSDDA